MPVPCLCLGMSYSSFRNLAQGLHNWWDPLQMRCHFSKHTIWASLLVSGRRSNPWAKLLEMPVACLCIGKSHSHSRTLAQCFLNQKVDPKCGRIPQNDEYEARSLTGDLILEPNFGNACALPMPRWVSSPFQNFGPRLALVVRPTPYTVKFINIWLDLQLPGRRSNPWAKFLGMPVPCLCLGLSYSNFRNLAQGLHNWWDPLQMRCHFSKHTIWASLLVSGRRSNPWAKFLGMPVLCLCLGGCHPHSRALAQGLH